jgi:tetratricopeptide (TPR) repeat protein
MAFDYYVGRGEKAHFSIAVLTSNHRRRLIQNHRLDVHDESPRDCRACGGRAAGHRIPIVRFLPALAITLLGCAAAPLLGAAVLTTTTAPAAGAVPVSAVDIKSLIESLADPDPAVRQRAGERLLSAGGAARPALLKASRSASPQISARAGDLLMQLPWSLPSDPPNVRQQLENYGQRQVEFRMKIIVTDLARTQGAEPALLRIVKEDPSNVVAWTAVAVLRQFGDDQVLAAERSADLTDAGAPLVALAGSALWTVDHARAVDVLHQAIELDAQEPAPDEASMEFVYQLLVTDAVQGGHIDQAADLLRRRARRASEPGDAADAVFGLFALYADHGAGSALQEDLQEFSDYLGRPEMMYALGRIYQRGGDQLCGEAIASAAFASSLGSIAGHQRAGDTIDDRAWNREARREYYAVLALSEGLDQTEREFVAMNAHRSLSRIGEIEGDHLSVAEHIEAMIDADAQLARRALPQSYEGLLAQQADWHRLHAARASNDLASADKYLAMLVDQPSADSDAATEVVDYLRHKGQTSQADAYFDRAYEAKRAQMQAYNSNAESMNEVAWLCACCDERIPEALRLAMRAVALAPENYAYLDTAASAQFAAGNIEQAIRLEKRALAMRPNDPFMRRQVNRFEEARNQMSGAKSEH